MRTLEFGYEVEATADADTIEDEVLPLVEKSVTDSILGEIFTECTTARRQLRVSRRLEITGVTQNPEDVVLDDGMFYEYRWHVTSKIMIIFLTRHLIEWCIVQSYVEKLATETSVWS